MNENNKFVAQLLMYSNSSFDRPLAYKTGVYVATVLYWLLLCCKLGLGNLGQSLGSAPGPHCKMSAPHTQAHAVLIIAAVRHRLMA